MTTRSDNRSGRNPKAVGALALFLCLAQVGPSVAAPEPGSRQVTVADLLSMLRLEVSEQDVINAIERSSPPVVFDDETLKQLKDEGATGGIISALVLSGRRSSEPVSAPAAPPSGGAPFPTVGLPGLAELQAAWPMAGIGDLSFDGGTGQGLGSLPMRASIPARSTVAFRTQVYALDPDDDAPRLGDHFEVKETPKSYRGWLPKLVETVGRSSQDPRVSQQRAQMLVWNLRKGISWQALAQNPLQAYLLYETLGVKGTITHLAVQEAKGRALDRIPVPGIGGLGGLKDLFGRGKVPIETLQQGAEIARRMLAATRSGATAQPSFAPIPGTALELRVAAIEGLSAAVIEVRNPSPEPGVFEPARYILEPRRKGASSLALQPQGLMAPPEAAPSVGAPGALAPPSQAGSGRAGAPQSVVPGPEPLPKPGDGPKAGDGAGAATLRQNFCDLCEGAISELLERYAKFARRGLERLADAPPRNPFDGPLRLEVGERRTFTAELEPAEVQTFGEDGVCGKTSFSLVNPEIKISQRAPELRLEPEVARVVSAPRLELEDGGWKLTLELEGVKTGEGRLTGSVPFVGGEVQAGAVDVLGAVLRCPGVRSVDLGDVSGDAEVRSCRFLVDVVVGDTGADGSLTLASEVREFYGIAHYGGRVLPNWRSLHRQSVLRRAWRQAPLSDIGAVLGFQTYLSDGCAGLQADVQLSTKVEYRWRRRSPRGAKHEAWAPMLTITALAQMSPGRLRPVKLEFWTNLHLRPSPFTPPTLAVSMSRTTSGTAGTIAIDPKAGSRCQGTDCEGGIAFQVDDAGAPLEVFLMIEHVTGLEFEPPAGKSDTKRMVGIGAAMLLPDMMVEGLQLPENAARSGRP